MQTDRTWLEKAEKELGETSEVKEEKLKELRELLSANENIPKGREDDAFLLRFLRAKKFDVEKVFKMVISLHPFSINSFYRNRKSFINFRCRSIIQ